MLKREEATVQTALQVSTQFDSVPCRALRNSPIHLVLIEIVFTPGVHIHTEIKTETETPYFNFREEGSGDEFGRSRH